MTRPQSSGLTELTSPEPFDLKGPLPWGRLAIEASAGTGKTYTLCHLAVRYIAEQGIKASEFLLVTFTRAATAELRGRIRSAITDAIADRREKLTSVDPSEPAKKRLEEELDNLSQALTDYDSITITTIHSFATQAITAMGATADFDPPRAFAGGESAVIASACSDAIVEAVASGVEPSLVPKLSDLTRAVGTASNSPDMIIEPADSIHDDAPDGSLNNHVVMASLVRKVLAMLDHRNALADQVTFDDVLTSLRDTVGSPDGASIIEAMRRRYRIVMIDEFQDTDPVQWSIFGTIFGEREDENSAAKKSETALILVGDPKQSIYSFRGADISTYVEAISTTGTRRVVLDTNWRSDGQLLKGLEALLTGSTYGPSIEFVPVAACDDNQARTAWSQGAPIVPVRVRLALGDWLPRNPKDGKITAAASVDALWDDVVAQVQHTLNTVEVWDKDISQNRPVAPSDIAVLVSRGSDAELIQRRLSRTGIPAVLSRAGKILESEAADQWRWLLDTLAHPGDSQRARRFTLGWFSPAHLIQANSITDGTATDPERHPALAVVDSGNEASMAVVFEQLRAWLDKLHRHGVEQFVHSALEDTEVIPRMLRRLDGDRIVTDLIHIGELLQTGIGDAQPTTTGLLNVLQTSPGDQDQDTKDEYARRIETEDSSVKIMTVWVSKGLEFPIVMAPTMFMDFSNEPDVIVPGSSSGTRVFDVSGKDTTDERKTEARRRYVDERLRLLYVAATRASHQLTFWWSGANTSAKSPLSRVLFARDEQGNIDPDLWHEYKVPIPGDADGIESLRVLEERSNGLIEVTVFDDPGIPGRWTPKASGTATGTALVKPPELTAAKLAHTPARTSGRWSFSAITAHGEHSNSFEDNADGDAGAADEQQNTESANPTSASPSSGSSSDGASATDGSIGFTPSDTSNMPLGWLPAGAAFGTLVHSIYEHLDFTDPDPREAIATIASRELAWRGLNLTPPLIPGATHDDGVKLLVDGLALSLATPLGELFNGCSLAALGQTDRLNELSFELLLGNDSGTPTISDREIGSVIASYIGEVEPLGRWARQLSDGRFDVNIGGHLTGSIDAVFRVSDQSGDRFIVADYKTNRLTRPTEHPHPGHYDHQSMTEAMAQHHYPLQSLLYSVALHRYLRSRLPGYDPGIHLGGVCYLFVRGMTGPDNPVIDGHPSGVWNWRPPVELVIDLSDLLSGETMTVGAGDLK